MEADGPLLDTWPTQGHRLLFGDLPLRETPSEIEVVSPHPSEDARTLLRDFMRHVGRRPWTSEDEASFIALYPDHQLDDLLIDSALAEPQLYFSQLVR